jgi:hypothetical protein
MGKEEDELSAHPLSFEAHLIFRSALPLRYAKNFWSSECQYACIIGRVATKVNEVNFQFSIVNWSKT